MNKEKILDLAGQCAEKTLNDYLEGKLVDYQQFSVVAECVRTLHHVVQIESKMEPFAEVGGMD